MTRKLRKVKKLFRKRKNLKASLMNSRKMSTLKMKSISHARFSGAEIHGTSLNTRTNQVISILAIAKTRGSALNSGSTELFQQATQSGQAMIITRSRGSLKAQLTKRIGKFWVKRKTAKYSADNQSFTHFLFKIKASMKSNLFDFVKLAKIQIILIIYILVQLNFMVDWFKMSFSSLKSFWLENQIIFSRYLKP